MSRDSRGRDESQKYPEIGYFEPGVILIVGALAFTLVITEVVPLPSSNFQNIHELVYQVGWFIALIGGPFAAAFGAYGVFRVFYQNHIQPVLDE